MHLERTSKTVHVRSELAIEREIESSSGAKEKNSDLRETSGKRAKMGKVPEQLLISTNTYSFAFVFPV